MYSHIYREREGETARREERETERRRELVTVRETNREIEEENGGKEGVAERKRERGRKEWEG